MCQHLHVSRLVTKFLNLYQAFFRTPRQKKAWTATVEILKICDKPRNVQILAPAKGPCYFKFGPVPARTKNDIALSAQSDKWFPQKGPVMSQLELLRANWIDCISLISMQDKNKVLCRLEALIMTLYAE